MTKDDQLAASDFEDDWLLRAFDVNGSVDRFLVLPVRAMRLVTAAAALTRLRSVHDLAVNGDLFSAVVGRGPDLEWLYGVSHAALLASLDGEPAFAPLLDLVRQTFPLSPTAFAVRHDQWISMWGRPVSQAVTDEVERARFAPKPNISALEVELKRLGAQEGVDPFSSDLNAFLLKEDAIQTLSGNVFDVVQETWQRRLLASPPPPPFPAPGVLANERRAARRGGRPRIELSYEQLARTYWEMATESDDLDDLRVPAQRELIQRLASQGIRLTTRTLNKRIQEWLSAGHPWPPPDPMQ
jgi:hypothetical protein